VPNSNLAIFNQLKKLTPRPARGQSHKWLRNPKLMAALFMTMLCAGGAWGKTLRIVSYNIDCSDQTATATSPTQRTACRRWFKPSDCITWGPMRSRWT
jgi:hypothetical protein